MLNTITDLEARYRMTFQIRENFRYFKISYTLTAVMTKD